MKYLYQEDEKLAEIANVQFTGPGFTKSTAIGGARFKDPSTPKLVSFDINGMEPAEDMQHDLRDESGKITLIDIKKITPISGGVHVEAFVY